MSSGPPHRTFIEVSLQAIRANYLAIASQLDNNALMMPVVKANAYGHGAIPVSQTLIDAGARWLAVSNTMEAVALRQGGIPDSTRILIMAGIHQFDWPFLIDYHLTPVLHSLVDINAMERLGKAARRRLPFHFKFDTGLSRLGSQEPIEYIVRRLLALEHSRLEGVMTHFASAADLLNPKTANQASLLRSHVERLREAGLWPFLVHVDATNSLHLVRHNTEVHLVRPGHAIYGYVTEPRAPSSPGRLAVQPALTWKTRVILVKTLPAGASVGYGSTYKTSRPTTIAVLSVGYADGYPHQLTNRGHVLLHGKRAPILGAVSMDLTTVDASEIPAVSPGDSATLLGRDGSHVISAVQLGRLAGTISYAVLCGISERVPRLHFS